MSTEVRTPPGYLAVTTDAATALASEEAQRWVAKSLDDGGTLYAAAVNSGARTLGGGRSAVRLLPAAAGPGEWVVRHYHRGGLVGPIWHDRYFRAGRFRSFVEVESSLRLREAGVRTPRVVAAAAYPSGLIYRADLVTRRVMGATLIDRLRESEDPGQWEAALRSADLAIHSLSAAEAYHVDLNARNLLLDPDPSDTAPAWVLDLDRMRFGQSGRTAARAMRGRLLRSLTKLSVNAQILAVAQRTLAPKGLEG